jgi:hypothetical protein
MKLDHNMMNLDIENDIYNELILVEKDTLNRMIRISNENIH